EVVDRIVARLIRISIGDTVLLLRSAGQAQREKHQPRLIGRDVKSSGERLLVALNAKDELIHHAGLRHPGESGRCNIRIRDLTVGLLVREGPWQSRTAEALQVYIVVVSVGDIKSQFAGGLEIETTHRKIVLCRGRLDPSQLAAIEIGKREHT